MKSPFKFFGRNTKRQSPRTKSVRRSRLAFEMLEQRRVLASVISEVHIDPLFGANSKDTDQFIELRGAPGTTLPTGSYFVVLEGFGSGATGMGYIHSSIDLSGLSFGSNGFLVLAQKDHPYQIASESTSVVSTAIGFSGLPDSRWSDASTLSDRLAFIFTSATFLLIQAPAKPVPASDADSDDNGTLDGAAANWNIIDSVGLLRKTFSPARSYGKITFSQEPNNLALAPSGTVFVNTDGVGYVGRIGASTGWAASDWVAGATRDFDNAAPIQYQLTYGSSTSGDPRPLAYAGRSIDHVGTFNFDGGARGTVRFDTNGDGSISGADAPLPNVIVFADQNGNSVRDSITTQVLSTNYPEQTDLTNREQNATLTVADQNNKNLAFAVRTKTFASLTSLSSEGIHWFESTSRLKVMFYQEADGVSIQAIGASGSFPSYGRLEIYNRDNQLIGSTQTGPLQLPQRATLSLSRVEADIKYAIIYNVIVGGTSSPFGRFDNLNYSVPEFQSVSNAQGTYAIEELPKGLFVILANGGPSGNIPLSNQSYPLSVTKTEHLLSANFGFRSNLPPIIETSSISIPENPTVGSTVGQIVASDPDPGQTVTYQFLSSAGPFSIDSLTGAVKVANSSTWDFETTVPIVVELRVTDSFATPSSSTKMVTLSPSDVNEPPTVNAQEFTVPENSPIGTVIGQVVATDPDAGEAGTLQFAIAAGGPSNVFSLDSLDGTLKVVSNSLDFETKSVWTIPIVVTDQGSPSRSSNGTVTVRVSNVNESPTGITFSSVVRPPESTNVTSPIFVASIQIQDDALGTNTLKLSGADSSFFSIVGSQLRFQSASKLDFETKPTYVVNVEVDDVSVGATPDAVATFTLTITDVNEPPTGIQFSNPVTSIPESTNITSGVRVANLQAVDDALGVNTFSLSGVDASKFVIVGQELRLRSNTPLDFETQPSLQVTVAVDDVSVGSTPDATTTFTISVTDVNEAPIQVRLETLVSTILESTTPSVEVTLANASVTDDALGSNTLLLLGPDADKFAIVGNQLRLKPGTVFDFETKSTFDVTVRAEDTSIPGAVFPESNFRLSVGNRPEVISVTDSVGNSIASPAKSIRITWDSVTDIAPDALRLTKVDVGVATVPLSFTKSNVNNRTVADLAFSGPFAGTNGLLDGTYVLDVDGTKVTTSTGVSGVNYTSSSIGVQAPLLPGVLSITGPSSVQRNLLYSIQVNLSGIVPPPVGNVDYKIDIDGDGTIDRTESGPLSLSVNNLRFASAGSFTSVIIAERNGVVLGKGTTVVDVSPATTASEDWLSALDSDRDDSVSPLDVLVIINRINSRTGSGPVPYSLELDVDRDGSITPLDVLSVINFINADPSSRTQIFGSLVMNSSGGVRGLTNDLSISGQILGSSRNLVVMLDGSTKVDASKYVQPNGSFEIQDAAIAELFGAISEGAHTLSVATQTGVSYSRSSDKRFYKMESILQDFQVTSALKISNDTRVQWSSSGSGARYEVYVAPAGATPVKVGSTTSSTEARLSLVAGSYDLLIESIDGAGNRKRSPKVTIAVI